MQPINIFFSCAPNSLKDRRYVEALENHLADQKRFGEVTIWHVHKASPGTNVEQEILTQLNKADIILIFLSPDYMADDYCVDKVGTQAVSIETWGIATVRVIPIRHVDWRNAPFNFCQPLPKSGEFISKSPFREEVLHNVALDISELVKESVSSRSWREAIRVEKSSILQQAHFMPVMVPIETLIKKKQTDNIKLERRTDEVKIERHTDEIKGIRRTEELKKRKTNTRVKQRRQVLYL